MRLDNMDHVERAVLVVSSFLKRTSNKMIADGLLGKSEALENNLRKFREVLLEALADVNAALDEE